MLRRGAALKSTHEKLQEQPSTVNPKKNKSLLESAPAADTQLVTDGLRELETEIGGNRDRPPSAVLTRVVERVCSLTGAEGAAIALCDESGVVCRASTGEAPAVGSRLQAESGLTRECFETGQVVVCDDAETDSRIPSSVAKNLHLRSAIAVPIEAQDSCVGIVEVLSSRPFAFGSTHVDALQHVAQLLAPVLIPAPVPALAPTPAVPAPPPVPKFAQEPARKARLWLIALGVAAVVLALLLILFFSGKLRRIPTTMPSTTANAPASSSGQEQATREPQQEEAGKTAEEQSRTGSEHAPGPVSAPNAAAKAVEEKSREAGPRKSGAVPVEGSKTQIVPPTIQPSTAPATPAPEQTGKEEKATEGSPAPASETPAVTAKLAPLELPPSLTPAAKAPNAEIAATMTPPMGAIAIVTTTPKFVLDRTLQGHSGWVTSVAFTADGQRLASGSWDQDSVKVWDVPTGRELGAFASKNKGVQALAFSRDGHWLAAESSSNTVTLWDTLTGHESHTLAGDKPLGILGDSWVYSIAFSPDGRWLASGVDNKTVRVWDVQTGHAIRDLDGLQRSVIYAAFSPDGRLVASGSDDKTIKIWDVASGKEVRTLRAHKKDVYAVAFSPDGRWLASASGDKTLKLWEVATGREVHTLTGHRHWVTTLAFSPDARWLASGSWDKTVKIWDVQTGQELETLAGHSDHVYTVAFDQRGRRLASGSEDGTIKLWRLSTDLSRSR
jgi:WD40 repeat protein